MYIYIILRNRLRIKLYMKIVNLIEFNGILNPCHWLYFSTKLTWYAHFLIT